MAALSVFALTGCDLTKPGLGSLTKPFENFSILDLVDPLEWFHKKDKGGEEDKKDDTVAVASVTLSPTSISLKVNQEKTLTATVLPENATNKTVTWTSTDAQVASVADGKVKGLKAGTAKIKATAGGKIAECSVVVTEASGDDDPDEIVEITKVNAPETIEQNKTLATTQVTLEVELADGSVQNDVHPEEIVLDTSKLGEVEGTVKIAGLSATFTIEVVTGQVVPPVTDIITPQQAMALMDAAGDGKAVANKAKVKGIVAQNTKYDATHKEYTTGFDGVENFKLQFKDPNNILNGGSPDGMEVVVEGYLEKYQGKYQLSYLPASASPSGQAETPVLVSAQQVVHEAALDSITVSNTHREFFVGGTFVGETVTAHYSDGATATVTGTFTGYNLANEGTQTVTVSYTEKGVTKTTTYSITVSPKADIGYGTEAAPLTVTQALQVITQECTSDSSMTAQAITVQGTIAVVKNTFTYESGPCFEFDITDGTSTVYVYRCHCTEAQKSGVIVGATVKLVGYAKNFKGTLEFVDNGKNQCHILSVGGGEVPPTPDKELVSIEIAGSLSKTTYYVGDTYSAAGLSIKAHYDDGSEGTVQGTINLNKPTAALGDTQVIANATFNGLDAEAKTFTVTVSERPPVVEQAFTKVQSQDDITAGDYLLVYEESETKAKIFNGIDVAVSNGNSAVDGVIDSETIQVDSSFIRIQVEAMTGGFSLKVVGGENDGKYLAGTADINGTKFESTPQLNTISHTADKGDQITSNGVTIMYNKATDQARFRYYKPSSTQQPVHLYKLSDGPVVQKTLESISIEGSLTKTNYSVGQDYSTDGLTVKGHYDNGSVGTVDAKITLDKTKAALGDTQVVANATFNGFNAEPKTFTVTVTEAVVSEERAFDLGGSETVVYNGVTYEKSLKAGSGKAAGSTTINVPTGATKFIFFIAGWNGENVKVSVSGAGVSQTLTLTSDSGLTGNSPFTIAGTDDTKFKFELTTTGGSMKFEATSGKRFVIWNASYVG